MIPILSSTSTLTGNGLGRLADALSCTVTHEINGEYELQMTYPITGAIFSELANDCVIWADADNYAKNQGFRIYRITRPLNGIVSIYARHLSYDMSGFVCEPMNESSLTTALANLASNCVPTPCPFTFSSPRTVATAYKTSVPMSLWQMMGGIQGSLLDVYGGEWDFDNYTATLRNTLGTDRGVNIRYGKNMTELEQDATIEAKYGGIYPYWYDEESGTLVTLPEDYITVSGGGSRVLCLDFSGDFEDAPTVTQLRNRATQYATANKVGEAKISWKVGFVPLSKSEEYKSIAALETVQLGDTVHVFYEPMNLTATARAVKTEYNVLLDRFETVTLGRVKQNLAKIVVEQKKDLEHSVALVKTTLEHAIDEATDFITNGEGYMRFIYNSADELVEIVSLDDPDINQATSVWRWNNGGFGHSSTGYNGTYTAAITQNGAIVADFITAGTLNANVIRAGLLADANTDNYWDLTSGQFTITKGTININASSSTDNLIQLNYSPYATKLSPLELEAKDSNFSAIFWANGVQVDRASNSNTVINLGTSYSSASNYGSYFDLAAYESNSQVSLIELTKKKIILGPAINDLRITLEWSSSNGGTLNLNDGASNKADLKPNSLALENGTQMLTMAAGGSLGMYNGASKYSVILWPDSNGEGRVILGDGTSTKWRTSLENTGLVFRDASDNVTATYPNTGLAVKDLNGNTRDGISTSGTTKTYTLAAPATYLVTTMRSANSSTAQDGIWLVASYTTSSSSHITTIKAPTGTTTCSISGSTLTIVTGSNNVRVTITRLD